MIILRIKVRFISLQEDRRTCNVCFDLSLGRDSKRSTPKPPSMI